MEELLDKPEITHKKRKRTFLSVLTIAVVVIYATGILLSIYSIYSIIYSGPAIAIVGIIALIAGLILREKIVILFGSGVILSVLGTFLLIFLFHISPMQAKPIVPIIGGFCLLVLIGLTVSLFISLRDR